MDICLNKKHYYLLFAFSIIAAVIAVFIYLNYQHAQAISDEEIGNIVQERGGPGGCDSLESCQVFCDNPDNFEICIDWAVDNGIMTQEEADQARRFHGEEGGPPPISGPGGCNSPESCHAYCEQPEHFDECLSFAENQGFISKEEAARARRGGPGGCNTREECDTFCRQPQNQDICLDFAVQEGFLTQEEADRIKEFSRRGPEEFRDHGPGPGRPGRPGGPEPGFDEDKARRIVESQGGPGGCATFDECDQFCSQPENDEVCFEFAERHELFTDKEEFEKIRRIMKEGGPGGCQGEIACRNYCDNPDNAEECLNFAIEHDFMSPEEAEYAREGLRAFADGGPVGANGEPICLRPQDCERACQLPENQEFCFEWAKKHGLIPEHELREFERVESLHRRIDEQGGPGGCTTKEECIRFCSDPVHRNECALHFGGPEGAPPGGIFREVSPGVEGEFRPDHFPSDAECPREYLPVCGIDNITYPNRCVAEFKGVQIVKEGPCGGEFRPPFSEPTGVEGFECPDIQNPVCGIDDVTYINDCFAKKRGVRISKFGPCEPGETVIPIQTFPGTFPGEDIDCPAVFDPVCGINGETYPNECVARREGIGIAKPGPCEQSGSTPFPTPIENTFLCPEIFDPVCGSDNKTYSNDCFARKAGVNIVKEGRCEFESTPLGTPIPEPTFEPTPLGTPIEFRFIFPSGFECSPKDVCLQYCSGNPDEIDKESCSRLLSAGEVSAGSLLMKGFGFIVNTLKDFLR